jgi:hypothetical protein
MASGTGPNSLPEAFELVAVKRAARHVLCFIKLQRPAAAGTAPCSCCAPHVQQGSDAHAGIVLARPAVRHPHTLAVRQAGAGVGQAIRPACRLGQGGAQRAALLAV